MHFAMKLYHSPASPFVRKARIAAAVLGLDKRIELVAADTSNPFDAIRVKNPLGKIPVLELDDGACIYGSSVISAYLDDLAGGGKLIPRDLKPRYEALTLESLADGIAEASILQIYEKRMRAENEYSASWVAHQSDKVLRGLAHFESSPPPRDFNDGVPRIDQIMLACALGYLDLRFEGAWRSDHPKLVAWLDAFATAVPSFAATSA
jgi:glutathione S-transferase